MSGSRFVDTGRVFRLHDFTSPIFHKSDTKGKKTDYVLYKDKYQSVAVVTKKLDALVLAKKVKDVVIKDSKGFDYEATKTTISYTKFRLENIVELLDKDSKDLPREVMTTTVHNNTFDSKWMDQMDAYITNLSTYDIFTLHGYTTNSQGHINAFLRGELSDTALKKYIKSIRHDLNTKFIPMYMQIWNLRDQAEIGEKDAMITDVVGKTRKRASVVLKECQQSLSRSKSYTHIFTLLPHFSYEFMKKVFMLFAADISRIINSAPMLTKTVHVFRGEEATDNIILDREYHAFVSTSVCPSSAALYLKKKRCCIKRIILQAGMHAIFLQGVTQYKADIEVLLDKNIVLRAVSEPFQVSIKNIKFVVTDFSIQNP
jgi:hypothetical protein